MRRRSRDSSQFALPLTASESERFIKGPENLPMLFILQGLFLITILESTESFQS